MSCGLLTLLFDTSPPDRPTDATVAAVLLAAAAVGAVVAAWRAARVAPAVALQTP